MRFKSLGSLHSTSGLWGTGGQGLWGHLLIKSFHVSLFGATPDDMRVWQAFPYKPFCANEMAQLSFFFPQSLLWHNWGMMQWMSIAEPYAIAHQVNLLTTSHKEHQLGQACCGSLHAAEHT